MLLSRIRDRLSACYKSEACLDAVIVAALVVPVYLFADHYNGFERLYQTTRALEDWQLDEVVTAVVFLGLAGFFLCRSPAVAIPARNLTTPLG